MKKMKDTELSIPEFQLENKEMILNDRINISDPSILNTSQLKTTEAGLTTREKDSHPWWNECCKEKSKKLWLPTEIDCADSVSNSSSRYSNNIKPQSWFSITKNVPKKKSSLKTSYPSLQSSVAGFMVLENTSQKSNENVKLKKKSFSRSKEKTPLKVKIVRLYPDAKQRAILRDWFGTARKCYNLTIEAYNKDKKLKLNYDTQSQILETLSTMYDHSNVNLEVKRQAIQQAFITIENHRDDKLKFKSRKDPTESIYVRNSCISKSGKALFPRTLGTIKFKGANKLYSEADGSYLVRKRNKYYIHLTLKAKQPEFIFKDTPENTTCALDPNSDTFYAYYSPLDCGKIGEGAGRFIFNRCSKLDKLRSKIDKSNNSKQRTRMWKAYYRLSSRIKNQVSDLHWKTARFLCDTYDQVIVPRFSISSMIKKNDRNIKSKTVRMMCTLSHYSFLQKLEHKAKETETTVLIVNEPYTSKTCGCCGFINKLKLTDRVFNCSNCNLKSDRDIHAARNIFIRTLNLIETRKLRVM